jgi:predicted CoA-substrate-specific enzyme activase
VGIGEKGYGACLGASTITAVEILRDGPAGGQSIHIVRVVRRAHEGNLKAAFGHVVAELGFDGGPILVTGRAFRHSVAIPSISEPEAIERALEYLFHRSGRTYDAVVSAGGETFVVYALDSGQKVCGISTGNKCASGTGEFFLQQIRRMDLGIEQAIERALTGSPYAVSGRCSVFCKSDCTHALNKGVPIADVTAGLCRMIAQKIVEILDRVPHEKALLIGGTAANAAVVERIRSAVPGIEVPEEAPYFEALGAAIASFERGSALPSSLFDAGHASFSFLPPLRAAEPLVSFRTIEFDAPRTGDRCIIGLDVGSTTTKILLVRLPDHAFLASEYLRTNGNPIEASRACFSSLLTRLDGTAVDIVGIGVTGSGRMIAGLYALTDGIVNEIIAHAAAAAYFDPEVDTIFEIGGQDAKYTYLTSTVASDYAMNLACSAGTGSFLEESAKESLGIGTEEIAEIALRGERPPSFNDQCAAFISSDIKNATHSGIGLEDIVAGLVYSICFNYINRVKGSRPVGRKIFMQGGVCYNRAVPIAMAALVRKPIVVPPEPGLMGAFGVALELEKRLGLGLVSEEHFDLPSIIGRKVSQERPFVCAGGRDKCDLKCSISRIRVADRVFPFGGTCNRYYSLGHRADAAGSADGVDPAADYVSVRNELMFRKYAQPRRIDPDALVIGLPTTFFTMSLFPLFYNFFAALGCRVLLPDGVEADAANPLVTSMCSPAEIATGLYENLAKKGPDRVFLPFIKEMYVPGGNHAFDYSATCGLSMGCGIYLRQAFRLAPGYVEILSPFMNLRRGLESGEEAFVGVGAELGFAKGRSMEAFREALAQQHAFEDECRAIGRRVLEELRQEPERTAIVLFGRPYNAYAPEANKGIPKKIASRGDIVIPYDMLPIDEEPIPEDYRSSMYWEAGQRILKGAAIVKRDRQLYGVFITNFLCAPDSFVLSYFRRVMASKPSLTLELDAHTADAGLDTRIDAFQSIVRNHRKIQGGVADPVSPLRPARVSMENRGAFFVDSAGQKLGFTDPRVKVIFPPLGDHGSYLMAAGWRRLGMNVTALPPADNETLQIGRSVTSGKECIPLIVCIGGLIKYLRSRPPESAGEKCVFFIPHALGYCRLGQYNVSIRDFVKENRVPDVATLNLSMSDRFAGMGPRVLYNAWKAVVCIDLLDDLYCSLLALAVDAETGTAVFEEEFTRICDSFEGISGVGFYDQLRTSMARFAAIPLKQALADTARIAFNGEFFVRKDAFSNLGLAYRLARKGFVVSTATLTEIMYYMSYLQKNGVKKASYTLAGWLEAVASAATQRAVEKKIKGIFATSGLVDCSLIDVESTARFSSFIVPRDYDGEQVLVSGMTYRDAFTRYCGVVNVGPFGCIQTRLADAVTVPTANVRGKRESYAGAGAACPALGLADDQRIPFLTVESDGNPYPQLLEARFESFCLQAARVAKEMGKAPAPQRPVNATR